LVFSQTPAARVLWSIPDFAKLPCAGTGPCAFADALHDAVELRLGQGGTDHARALGGAHFGHGRARPRLAPMMTMTLSFSFIGVLSSYRAVMRVEIEFVELG
jgi:hypothetical protein